MKNIVLPKIVAVGIYNAQIAMKNRTVSPNRKTTMFELELPLEKGGVSYINDDSHSIDERVVICAKPGQIRHTRFPFKCYYIHMILNEGALFDTLSSFPSYIELDGVGKIREVFAAICERYNTGLAKDELMLQSLILKLIYML